MLRELHEVLTEMQEALAPMASAAQAGMRIAAVELTLPIDVQPVLRDGGCALLADVSRNFADAAWHDVPTRLHWQLEAAPTAPDAMGSDIAALEALS